MNKTEDKWTLPQKYLWTIRRNQIKDQRLIFSHPIYGGYIMRHFPTAVMLDTFEFNRLHYIRQANLQYLIRPSATHTRSNHLLGSLTLLSKVLSNIYTNIRRYQPNVANEIIDEIKKYEKHLELALMLHDIGVPPFSHVLEPILEDDIMKKEIGGKVNHEDIALHLIDGKKNDKIVQSFRKFFDDGFLKNLGLQMVSEKILFLKEENELNDDDIKIIKYLIEPDSQKMPDVKDIDKSLINALSKLINSIFDIDRIEHLMSDIYYSGFSSFRYDFTKIVEGYIILRDKDEFKMAIIEDFLSDFMSFLLTRLEIKRKLWSDYNVRGYEAMLQHAVRYAIKSNDDFNNFYSWTDEYLLQKLSREAGEKGSMLAKQLIWRSQMYELLYEINLLSIVWKKYHETEILYNKISELKENLEHLKSKVRDKALEASKDIPYLKEYLMTRYQDIPYIYLPPKNPENYLELISDAYGFNPNSNYTYCLGENAYVRGFLQNFNIIEYDMWRIRIYVPQFMVKDLKNPIIEVFENEIATI